MVHPMDPAPSEPSSQPLREGWEFRREGSEIWKAISLPSSFERHEGPDFDGIGWYRRAVHLPEGISENARIVLRFEGAATETTVWCEGVEVGSHLGGWTPFECDLTDDIRSKNVPGSPVQPIEVIVRLDERVGHNSQGFLPVFAPHFGGLWKEVTLCIRPALAIDNDALFAWGDIGKACLQVETPMTAKGPMIDALEDESLSIRISHRLRIRHQDGASTAHPWSEAMNYPLNKSLRRTLAESGRVSLECSVGVDNPVAWSPEQPALYDVQVQLVSKESLLDVAHTTAGFRTIEAKGDQLHLNGRPIQVRGILNWGYAPPDTAPSLDPEFWAKELDLVRMYGFNLMKFCLWVPPKDYLRMADERGILVWMEYPTWHSKWSADQLPTLEKEFDEFFRYDRPHPCVILRSLTCETGPSADLNVLRSLYDQCHARIPGSLVEDDSSWIQWNRIHDFYDDHPYGNNHTWVATLDRLKTYIAEREAKPLVLGEAIAADTWLHPDSLTETVGGERPFWLPGFFDANREWGRSRQADMGALAVARLESDSLDYALRMRKFQIETYRREVPFGGYVVSVIRDFPFAGMGLLDYRGLPKWPKESWAWHADSTLILQTENDRRSFHFNETIKGKILVSDFEPSPRKDGKLRLTLSRTTDGIERSDARVVVRERPIVCDDQHGVKALDSFEFSPNDLLLETLSKDPVEVTLRAEWIRSEGSVIQNAWQLWLTPPPFLSAVASVGIHSSCDAQTRELFSELSETTDAWQDANVIVAQALDLPLLERIESGGRVLLIPNGEKQSLPLQSHWFLRGGPIIASSSRLDASHSMIRQLQHFDLASDVVPNMRWLEEVSPMVMLWDNHDIREVRTHGLLFAARLGDGALLVNAFHLYGSHNAAGRFLARELLNALAQEDPLTGFVSQGQPLKKMKQEMIASIRSQLQERSIDLTDRLWRFRLDTDEKGLVHGWHLPATPLDQGWKDIRVGLHWDGQGFANHDGWGWYAIELELPSDWSAEKNFLWIDGGDDYFEVFVDGRMLGSAGDIAARKTAFEDRVAFEIKEIQGSGNGLPVKVRIAIRVFDWQGAGGLFRPIQWKNVPRSNVPRILE